MTFVELATKIDETKQRLQEALTAVQEAEHAHKAAALRFNEINSEVSALTNQMKEMLGVPTVPMVEATDMKKLIMSSKQMTGR
jgi:chromosome segregation ATPase